MYIEQPFSAVMEPVARTVTIALQRAQVSSRESSASVISPGRGAYHTHSPGPGKEGHIQPGC